MLLTGTELLGVADEHHFSVPAFNVADYHMFNGLVEVCERKQSPLIVAIHPNEINLLGFEVLYAIRERCHRSSLPIVIHLDHGASHAQVVAAIKGGYTSVMIDASMLPFAENVAMTREVVEIAHAVGISVEGELGTIGSMDSTRADGGITYTDPEEAVRFVEQTGVDSLAVAIGTRHGIYPDHIKPELKLDLLADIKAAVGIPLVLHGGSGNPDAEVAEAAKRGVCKVNLSSDLKVAYHEKLREVLTDRSLREPDEIQPAPIAAMQDVAAQKIDLLGSGGTAQLYRHPDHHRIDLLGSTKGQTV